MSQKFDNIKLSLDDSLEEKLQLLVPNYSHFRILRQSVDARKRHELHLVYAVEVFGPGESIPDESFLLEQKKYQGPKPIIVGTGPAGLFAALRLIDRGIASRIFERGSMADARMRSINRHWRYGELDENNNVCFGEGGAGLYSDGKLITRIKSEHIPYVMHKLVEFGAPEEIKYLSNPHVGSDRIRRVIPKLREYLISKGCEFYFDTPISELIVENSRVVGVKTKAQQIYRADHVVLATGHSAKDIFSHLQNIGVFVEGKSFAMGLRIEHPQKFINQTQYRQFAEHPKLGAANYKLTHHDDKSGVGVYSFCMCPGGYVISSGTEASGVVSNGMSNYNRNSPFANAAIVVSVDYETHFGKNPFAGLQFRAQLEERAQQEVLLAGGRKELPAQLVTDFLAKQKGDVRKGSSPSGAIATRLDEILPQFIYEKLAEGLNVFDHKMRGFVDRDAQLYGVETRTSCPLRVTRREDTLQSLSHPGLYPAGEGAGYAGGITSAAVDGVKIADAIFFSL